MAREASVERNTKETEIKLKLNLDGTGYSDIETGVGFFDPVSGSSRYDPDAPRATQSLHFSYSQSHDGRNHCLSK